jgi:hypothetical protein
MYQKGQWVVIYQDPIMQTKPEGRAILMECLHADTGIVETGVLQCWKVRFAGEHGYCERTILQVKEDG